MAFAGITPDQAIYQGLDTWTVTLTNWGNTGAATDINSTNFPVAANMITIPSCAAVAIGANSTARDCGLIYRLLDSATPATVVDAQTRLSSDSPIVFAVSGPITVSAQNNVTVGDTYIKNGATATTAFPASPLFLRPSLVLDFYLRRPTTIQSMRSPFGLAGTTVMGGAGAEENVRILCIDGRRTVRVTTRIAGATAVATIRVGLIYLSGALAPASESNMTAPVVGAVDGQVNVFSVEHPAASLVALYYTLTAGAGSIQWSFDMRD